METKHTPGPWRVAKGPLCFLVGTVDAVLDGRAAVVAEVRRENDARLIAAAPELLDALRVIARISVNSPTGKFQPGMRNVWETAHAAIAKATGQ